MERKQSASLPSSFLQSMETVIFHEDYVRIREMHPASLTLPEYTVHEGVSGIRYYVFKNSFELVEFDLMLHHIFRGEEIVNFQGGKHNTFAVMVH